MWLAALATNCSLCLLWPQPGAQAAEPAELATSVDVAETANAAPDTSPFVVRSWQVEDGLPHNSVNAILQTSDGYLWLATNDGLARFDGVHFTVFGLREGLPSLRALALLEDAERGAVDRHQPGTVPAVERAIRSLDHQGRPGRQRSHLAGRGLGRGNLGRHANRLEPVAAGPPALLRQGGRAQ